MYYSMYISERVNEKYCYALETVWEKTNKKYHRPGKCIGYLDSDNTLVPNKYLSRLFALDSSGHASLTRLSAQEAKNGLNTGFLKSYGSLESVLSSPQCRFHGISETDSIVP
jgi:hypothetical protein